MLSLISIVLFIAMAMQVANFLALALRGHLPSTRLNEMSVTSWSSLVGFAPHALNRILLIECFNGYDRRPRLHPRLLPRALRRSYLRHLLLTVSLPPLFCPLLSVALSSSRFVLPYMAVCCACCRDDSTAVPGAGRTKQHAGACDGWFMGEVRIRSGQEEVQ